jgi:thioredoxin 1
MTMIRRRLALAGALGLAALPRAGRAGENAAFTDAAFDAAQAAGRPILIDVAAPWCPTCRAQKPHIDAAMADPAFKDAVFLTVDFDTQKAALRRLNARSQSTLIAFRGREERGRAVGITDPAAIRALLERAL